MQPIKDDFLNTLNDQIWSTKRIENNCFLFTSVEDKLAIKIICHHGDKVEIGNSGVNTERSELSEKYDICIGLNTPIWYSFSVYFPKDFEINNNRFVFAQWKQITEAKKSPFISLRYINGNLIVVLIHKDKRIKYKKEIDLRGKWNNFLINYELKDNQTGFASVWLNEVLIAQYTGELGFEAKEKFIYFKIGIYRDETDITQTLYFGKFRRSNDKEFCTR